MTDIDVYYELLIGGRVTDFRLESDELSDHPWPIYTLAMPSGDTLEMCLSRDPEGNGGGYAFIAQPNS